MFAVLLFSLLRVAGVVVDVGGVPVPGATVTLTGAFGAPVVLSDGSGGSTSGRSNPGRPAAVRLSVAGRVDLAALARRALRIGASGGERHRPGDAGRSLGGCAGGRSCSS